MPCCMHHTAPSLRKIYSILILKEAFSTCAAAGKVVASAALSTDLNVAFQALSREQTFSIQPGSLTG